MHGRTEGGHDIIGPVFDGRIKTPWILLILIAWDRSRLVAITVFFFNCGPVFRASDSIWTQHKASSFSLLGIDLVLSVA